MSKVVVPFGMFVAAHEAHCARNGVAASDGGLTATILEAALRWQDVELEKILEKPHGDFYRSESLSDSDRRSGHNAAINNVRRMFLAPEEPSVSPAGRRVLNSIMGSTFTPEDYTAIEFSLRTATHPPVATKK